LNKTHDIGNCIDTDSWNTKAAEEKYVLAFFTLIRVSDPFQLGTTYLEKERFNMAGNNRNQKLVSGAANALDQMKYEIATEFGIQLGADQTSRLNGSVGGEITKRLVAFAESHLSGGRI
jgi:Small, acid-soluble spore proteins, alpha/beta type